MDLLNRRSVLRFLLAASLSVLQPTSAISMAQESIAIEKTVPPTLMLPWACDWSVTCKGMDGNTTTTTGTAYHEFKDGAEEAAVSEAENHFAANCDGPPSVAIGHAYRTSGSSLSNGRGPVNPSSPECNYASAEEWLVKFECTGRKGGSYSKTSSGRTYCEALSKARAKVCEKINSPIFGGACRCCSSVVKRPVCYQRCAPRKKR